MSSTTRNLVIVGAGFSGTSLAVNLLRLPGAGPLNIILIERAQFARGLAYARLKYPYLLNVPAGRMSATAEDPGEFLNFARRSHPDATASDFLPRELYGEYLESLLLAAEYGAPAGTVLQRLVGIAVAIERVHRGAGFACAPGRRAARPCRRGGPRHGKSAPCPGAGPRAPARLGALCAGPLAGAAALRPGRIGADGRHGADDGGRGAGGPAARAPAGTPARPVAARPPAGSADTVPCG